MPIVLNDNRNVEVRSPASTSSEQRQRRRMVLALAVLLVALVVVMVKDRQLWWPSTTTPEAGLEKTAPPAPASTPATNPMASAVSREDLAHPPNAASKKEVKASRTAPSAPALQEEPAPMIAATDRAVLPPLEVEVVAGNQRRSLAPANNPVKVEMQSDDSTAQAQPPSDAATSTDPGSAHVLLSRDTSERVSRSVEPNYPLLAKQMKVQGAVVLQALIDKAGNIQDLHVVTGPTILAAAAREAVKQWHFKPYYQNGLPVETEARITVNFTISTY